MLAYQEDKDEFHQVMQLSCTARIYKEFGDVWGVDFIRWWYTKGRYLFISKEFDIKPPVNQIFWIQRGGKTEHFDFYLNQFTKHYEKIMENPNYPDSVNLFVPLRPTLKETMSSVRDYFKQFYFSPGAERSNTKFSIAKSKLREATVRDCFKVYELWTRQEKTDLASIGIQANVLRSSMADYKFSNKDLSQMDSLDSLRSGTSRQINNAIYLSENAAAGIMPSITKIPIIFKFSKSHLTNLFNDLKEMYSKKMYQKDALVKFAKKEKNIIREYSSYSERTPHPLDILVGQEVKVYPSKSTPRRSSSSRR
jgi:hypothetical protein